MNSPSHTTVGISLLSLLPASTTSVCALNSKYAVPSALAVTNSKASIDDCSPVTKTASAV